MGKNRPQIFSSDSEQEIVPNYFKKSKKDRAIEQ